MWPKLRVLTMTLTRLSAAQKLAQDLDGPVRGGVVDEQVLVVVARQGRHRRLDLLVDLADVAFLVVAGSEDRQQRHGGSFRRSGTGQLSCAPEGSVGGRLTGGAATAAEAEVLVAQVAADDHHPGQERLDHVDVERQHVERDGQQREVHDERHDVDEREARELLSIEPRLRNTT